MSGHSFNDGNHRYYFDRCLEMLRDIPYQHGVLTIGGDVQEIYDIDYAGTFNLWIIFLQVILLLVLMGGGVLIVVAFHACHLLKRDVDVD